MKFRKGAASLIATAALAAMLAGCSGTSSNAPSDITFDTTTGAFSFKTVEGGNSYTVGVSRVINDTTGEAISSINGSAQITVDGETKYVWSEQTGSVSGLSDTDGDGTIDGTVVFREYSSSATTVGAVMDIADLGAGEYILSVVPTATAELTDPETGYYDFVIEGTLAEPSGFTAQVNDAGNIEVTAGSNYYLDALSMSGIPAEVQIEVKDGDSVVETIDVDDFSYTNTVNGPSKAFSFTNQTVTGTESLDSSKAYTVTVTAVSETDGVESASADAYMASTTPAANITDTLDCGASATVGDYSVTLTIGANGDYELTANVNSVAILRETGTYTADAEAGTYDEKNTFPAGTKLTFTADASDFESSPLDGQTLTVSSQESQGGWGQQAGVSYFVEGTVTIDGESGDFSAAGGMGMMGPM